MRAVFRDCQARGGGGMLRVRFMKKFLPLAAALALLLAAPVLRAETETPLTESAWKLRVIVRVPGDLQVEKQAAEFIVAPPKLPEPKSGPGAR